MQNILKDLELIGVFTQKMSEILSGGVEKVKFSIFWSDYKTFNQNPQETARYINSGSDEDVISALLGQDPSLETVTLFIKNSDIFIENFGNLFENLYGYLKWNWIKLLYDKKLNRPLFKILSRLSFKNNAWKYIFPKIKYETNFLNNINQELDKIAEKIKNEWLKKNPNQWNRSNIIAWLTNAWVENQNEKNLLSQLRSEQDSMYEQQLNFFVWYIICKWYNLSEVLEESFIDKIMPIIKEFGKSSEINLEELLKEFASKKDEIFTPKRIEILQDRLSFMKGFFSEDNLNKLRKLSEDEAWKKIQELWNKLNCFETNWLAKANAFGTLEKRIDSITKYIDTFDYLAHWKDNIEERINNILNDDKYKLYGIGTAALWEIYWFLSPEEYVICNSRDIQAVKYLWISLKVPRWSLFGAKFINYNEQIKPIVETYKKIVWNLVGLPTNIEVDQFFSYISNKKTDSIKEVSLTPNSKPMNKINLNTILYWAPGTWKTFNTINYALAIVENKSLEDIGKESKTNRGDIKKRFDDFKNKGQIVFTSFHQSLGYEEFIEWIKAEVENWIINYEIQDGIFKEISNKALENWNNSRGNGSNITEILNKFCNKVNSVLEEWKKFELNESVIIEGVNYDSSWKFKSFTTWWSVKWQRLSRNIIERDYGKFKKWNIANYSDIKPTFESQSLSHGNAKYYFLLLQKIQEFENEIWDITNDIIEAKNYVLVVDEINRGNMSKIFGELITLLESDKRIWAEEELKVKLPYSFDEFGVPRNLYIVWTMNTADRSIALIDIALRRRFDFVEMEPDPSLLDWIKVWKIDVKKMVEKINERIEFLYDRDHKLWHSFFLPLKETSNLEKLNEIFYNKIIPLLQEYFYEDREKIQIVLWDHNEQGRKEEEDKIIRVERQIEKDVIWFDHEEIWDEKNIYYINKKLNENSYIWIYS